MTLSDNPPLQSQLWLWKQITGDKRAPRRGAAALWDEMEEAAFFETLLSLSPLHVQQILCAHGSPHCHRNLPLIATETSFPTPDKGSSLPVETACISHFQDPPPPAGCTHQQHSSSSPYKHIFHLFSSSRWTFLDSLAYANNLFPFPLLRLYCKRLALAFRSSHPNEQLLIHTPTHPAVRTETCTHR